jgi:hypothetical protein
MKDVYCYTYFLNRIVRGKIRSRNKIMETQKILFSYRWSSLQAVNYIMQTLLSS